MAKLAIYDPFHCLHLCVTSYVYAESRPKVTSNAVIFCQISLLKMYIYYLSWHMNRISDEALISGKSSYISWPSSILRSAGLFYRVVLITWNLDLRQFTAFAWTLRCRQLCCFLKVLNDSSVFSWSKKVILRNRKFWKKSWSD